MNQYFTIKEAALSWQLSERRIAKLCQEGRIIGAFKQGRSWLIPQAAQRPPDKRITSGTYIKPKRPGNLPLPIGISDYRLASSEYYYVDKTLLIKDFLDERPMVSLFTRPRRFGKTLNMDMLRTFFEKTPEDTSIYFKDKLIWSCGKKYQAYQGKYPVIFLTFKDVKYPTWQDTLNKLAMLLREEFSRHKEIFTSSKCSPCDQDYCHRLMSQKASIGQLADALLVLSKMLHEHYGIAPIIIIDEYDTPIQQGHVAGFYEQVILFMRNLFSGGLKDNKHLSYGFLTGILRVAKESIFSGLNNLAVNSLLDNKYSQYFGFTKEEVLELAQYYGAKDKFPEICQWYDGYQFGNTEIFNPWSVINYFRYGCQPRAYWQATGSNDIIGEILEEADQEIYESLQALLQGKTFITYIDTGVIYPQIRSNPSSIYSFLLVAGYLKILKADPTFNSDYMCQVALPNKEITFVYNKEILQKLNPLIPTATAVTIQEAIYSNNSSMLQQQLHKLLLQSASYYDTAKESFYHGLMLGLCALLDNNYQLTSNREAGQGRYDLALYPKRKELPGIIIELKAAPQEAKIQLQNIAEQALEQINSKEYAAHMLAQGVGTIFKYGVAFKGKQVAVAQALSKTNK